MNCEHFQERLYDYLDDTLSPSAKTAAEEHLRACRACHEAVQNELLLARTLSTRLEKAVESVALDASAQRKIAKAALQNTSGEPPTSHRSLLLLLLGRRGPGTGGIQRPVLARLALPFAATALILIGGIWMGRLTSEPTANRNPPASLAAGGSVASIHASDSVPVYTFHKEGNLVVDSLTCDTRLMDGALLENR